MVPRERVVMQWGLEAGGAPSSADLAALTAAWVAALNLVTAGGTLRSMLESGLTPRDLAVYPGGGGGVVIARDFDEANRVGAGTANVPPQVALVVSQLVVTGIGTRALGRTYLGTFGSSALAAGSGRPSGTLIVRALAAAASWHNALEARGLTPVVLNAAGGSLGAIVGYSAYDAWRTVRSRQNDATSTTVVNP